MQNAVWDLLTQPGGYQYMGRNMEVFLDSAGRCFRLVVTHAAGGYHGYYNSRAEVLKAVKDLHIYLTEKHFEKILEGDKTWR
jgi:hypothetical protein